MLVRPRRNRLTPQMRGLVRETSLSPEQFIYPMFVQDGEGKRTPISSMPGQARLSIDLLVETGEGIIKLKKNTEKGLVSHSFFFSWSRLKSKREFSHC